jgi:hypothetical protein
VGGALVAWLVFITATRLSDFEPLNKQIAGPYYAHLVPFLAGTESSRDVLEKLNPAMRVSLTAINAEPEAKVLRIGTQVTYFISRNDRRVVEDNQLSLFERMWSRGGAYAVTRRLRQQGIRFIVVDLNTAALDQTPERSLETKFSHLMTYLSNNPDLKLLATDRVVVSPGSRQFRQFNGQQVPVAQGISGQIVEPGAYAAFEINEQ